jgi:hypothetical protein
VAQEEMVEVVKPTPKPRKLKKSPTPSVVPEV